MKMEAVCFSEILVSTYQSPRCASPEDQRRHIYHREKLTFLVVIVYEYLREYIIAVLQKAIIT
jgi:hypothetical protein